MLRRQIIGVISISLWAALIAVTAIWAVKIKAGEVMPTQKASQEPGTEAESIETLARNLVNSLAKGDFKKATENFDETMKKALPAEKLQEAWNSITIQYGPFVEQTGTRRTNILQYDVIFVTCKFEKGTLDTKVVFNGKKQIAGLFFVPSQGTAK